ncbi:MAG TPA: anthranilate phosphoribosyltransferase [Candidatus Binataceae bacterium]|nr:anthranilate phosphoribosyltransferase [Candidatus Binataceae bacterium]
MSALRDAFDAVLAGRSLDADEAERAIGEMLDGGEQASEGLVAGFLIALKLKGESAGELTGGARAMRARARALDLNGGNVLDTAGTGGDGAGTFNISTGAALIAAAAGVPVAKHGNRAVTGRVGAADVLERMGVRIDLDPAGLERCLARAGMCFIFAPAYHPALARLGALRRALGTRTIFNLIAPLANPARPRRQLLGVGDAKMLRPIAEALLALGVDHAMAVHGRDGLDEISPSAATQVVEIRGRDEIREYEIAPSDFGLARIAPETLAVRDAAGAIAMLTGALAGGAGPAQDVLALNAGAAIYVGGRAKSLQAGVAFASEIIASGRALETIEKLRAASRADES